MARIQIELDPSVNANPFFRKPKSIQLSKPQIFKYAIYREEIPDFICEDDFEYLEGKVPYLLGLNGDWIAVRAGTILNLASDEKATEISEIIGVGAGLYYATKLLAINPNRITKIPHPTQRKKILDFSITKNQVQYEIETKGTAYTTNVANMKKDIKAKKKANKSSAVKIGTIAVARKKGDKDKSKLIVMDDFDDKTVQESPFVRSCIDNYLTALSLILDSTYYNRLRKQLDKGADNWSIPKEKIPNSYRQNGRKYLGQYFDRRLLLDAIREHRPGSRSVRELFTRLTKDVGREKYFVGIHEAVLDLLNKRDADNLAAYEVPVNLQETADYFAYADTDGIVIVRSKNKADQQVERRFPEKEVRKRLRFENDFVRQRPHECGAPCRSREIEGKPCEILTFREHCHFHR